MSREGLISGEYRIPSVGGESPVRDGEHMLEVDDSGVITVHSPLWEQPYCIGDGSQFKDPRIDHFLRTVIDHQFHHFSTRQLSLIEKYETRPGTSRVVRLGHLIDSAKLLADLGATFEQVVQTTVSDLAHPAGSHLRGDYLVGDYANQDTHDQDLWSYIDRSGLLDELKIEQLVDADGKLVGSPMNLSDLADPRFPRSEDIVECARPDNNADRAQFTFHEGVLISSQSEIQEAIQAIIRVETIHGERMAMKCPDAARLLYKLAVRHQSESWAEPMHRLMEELVLLQDRYLFAIDHPSAEFRNLQDFYPVDYARTDETTWYEQVHELGEIDPFITNIAKICEAIACEQREILTHCIGNDELYQGPTASQGVQIMQGSRRRKTTVSISSSGEAGVDELWVALPEPKYRGPIDSLVVTRSDLIRISELDPELARYADRRRRWIVPLIAKIAVPSSVAKELRYGIKVVNQHWSNTKGGLGFENPATRRPMPAEMLREQIAAARARVIKDALVV